jgi:hypothetical protein
MPASHQPQSAAPAAQLAAFVDAAAAQIGLPLRADHRPGVLQYFALAAGFAALVMDFPLSAHDDPAEAFVPIEPPLPFHLR